MKKITSSVGVVFIQELKNLVKGVMGKDKQRSDAQRRV
jgi:hypothetical protein